MRLTVSAARPQIAKAANLYDKHVSPPCSIYDSENRAFANSVFKSKFSAAVLSWNVLESYFQNLFFSKFIGWRHFPSWKTAFIYGVLNVFGTGSKKQVPRINASSIIAGMAHKKRFVEFSIRNLVGHSGCDKSLGIDPKVSISVSKGTFPIPAIIQTFNVYFSPKSFRHFGSFGDPLLLGGLFVFLGRCFCVTHNGQEVSTCD